MHISILKYLAFTVLILLAFVCGPFIVYGIPETATVYGVVLVSAGFAGTALAALGAGALGLLYKRNRFAGFVVGSLISVGLMFAGAHAETNFGFNGADLPSAISPRPVLDKGAAHGSNIDVRPGDPPGA